MSRTEKLAVALIMTALLVLLWEPIRSELRPYHPHLQNRQFGCISELFWMETVDRILTDAVEADDKPITLSRIQDLARNGCRDCDQCTDELLEQISRGEDVRGRPLQLRRVETDDGKVLHEIRSFGKDGRKERFLRQWVYDEVHYEQAQGPAKRLQLEHQITPADLAGLVAAAIPDASDQEALGAGPPPAERPTWPWSQESLRARLAEASSLLSAR